MPTPEQQAVLDTLVATARKPTVHTYGNRAGSALYFRTMHFPDAGSVIEGHTHNYPHETFLIRGAVHAKAWDASGKLIVGRVYAAPCCVLIRADVKHEFVALEADTLGVCVFGVRDYKGEFTSDWDGNMECCT